MVAMASSLYGCMADGISQGHYSIGAHDPLDGLYYEMQATENKAALAKRDQALAGKLLKDLEAMKQLYQHLLEGRAYFLTLPFVGLAILKRAYQRVQQ